MVIRVLVNIGGNTGANPPVWVWRYIECVTSAAVG